MRSKNMCMRICVALLCLTTGFLQVGFLQGKENISVDNRVLVNIRGHVITVVDVMKKLDMVFYRQFPQYKESSEARLQFYKMHWQKLLEDLIDRQIILAFAEDKQISVNNADVREELEEMFGPEVMINLYEAGLSLHDVQEMVKADILLRRIIGMYVRSPVMTSITPEMIKAAYQKLLQDGVKDDAWMWRSITLKKKGGDCPEDAALNVEELLKSCPLEEIPSHLPEGIEMIVSKPFRSSKKELSPSIIELLQGLDQGVWSPHEAYKGRSDQYQGWKFFCVDERIQEDMPELSEMEATLKEELTKPLMATKAQEFFDNLRKQYDVTYFVSKQELKILEPFSIKGEKIASLPTK